MNAIINAGTMKTAGKAVEQWYNAQDAVGKVIFKHSCIGGGIALIPIPLVGEIAVIINQVAMYKEINRLTGVKFSDAVLKNTGKFVISQVAGILGGVVVLLGASAVMKFIPIFNFLGAIIEAPAAGVANYVCGLAYYQMLGGLVKVGGVSGLSDSEILQRIKRNLPPEAEVKRMQQEAKEKMHGANYDAYRAEAQACADKAMASRAEFD